MVHPNISINHFYPIHPMMLQKPATNLIISEALKNKAHGWTSSKIQGEKWMVFRCVCSITNMVILRRNCRNGCECPSMCRYYFVLATLHNDKLQSTVPCMIEVTCYLHSIFFRSQPICSFTSLCQTITFKMANKETHGTIQLCQTFKSLACFSDE